MKHKFSWEKPIEQSTLEFCNSMAEQFRKAENHHRETGWFANNNYSEQLGVMAKAYETVAEYIEKEIKIRKSLLKK